MNSIADPSQKNKKTKIQEEDKKNNSAFLFSRRNYILLIVAICTLFFGLILLSGGGSDGYDYSEKIFSFQRIVLAPIMIIIALILCGISIMIKK